MTFRLNGVGAPDSAYATTSVREKGKLSDIVCRGARGKGAEGEGRLEFASQYDSNLDPLFTLLLTWIVPPDRSSNFYVIDPLSLLGARATVGGGRLATMIRIAR